MPIFSLLVSAELEGATSVIPIGSSSSGGAFQWRIRFSCVSCRETAAATSVFSVEDSVPLPNGHGEANLLQKCKFCNEQWCVSVVAVAGAELTADAPSSVRVADFEVRGCVPVGWTAGDGWTVKGSGAVFDSVDFSEGDVCEYDETSETTVEVRNVTGIFAPKK